MRITYDDEHDILYIDLIPNKKAKETKPLNDNILIDLDENKNIIGIEIWQASAIIIEPLAKQIAEKARKALELIK